MRLDFSITDLASRMTCNMNLCNFLMTGICNMIFRFSYKKMCNLWLGFQYCIRGVQLFISRNIIFQISHSISIGLQEITNIILLISFSRIIFRCQIKLYDTQIWISYSNNYTKINRGVQTLKPRYQIHYIIFQKEAVLFKI